jgi:hypothetical protein
VGAKGTTGASGTAGSAGNTVATSQTTTSTSYADLGTAGPSATVTVPASGNVLVIVTASATDSASGASAYVGFAVSGGNTQAAADAKAFIVQSGGNQAILVQGSASFFVSGLSAGSTTFTAKYRVSSGTGTFANRSIVVIPLA